MESVSRIIHGPPDRKRFDASDGRRWKLLVSYLPDWILTIVLVALIGGLTNSTGYKREFSLSDTSLQHTFATHERITFGECIVYAGVIPAVLIILTGAIWRRSFWDVHNGVLGLLLSVSITTVATQVVKICVGRPRPDAIDRCQPIEGAANLAVYGLATVARVCTVKTGHIIDDGFKSFPSGHSSFAWSGLLYLSLYASGKMHLFDRRGHTVKAWIAVTPIIGATLIAVSRTMDYRHHATDVIAGAILGSWVAVLTYHLYYPSLFSPQCHLPFSPRIPPTNASVESAALHGHGLVAHETNEPSSILPTHHRYTDSGSSADDHHHHHHPAPRVHARRHDGVGSGSLGTGPDGLGETAPRPSGGGVRTANGERGQGSTASVNKADVHDGSYYELDNARG